MGSTTLINIAEFERLEGPDHIELLKGDLIRTPPPDRRHMQTCRKLFLLLVAAVEQVQRENPDSHLADVEFEMGYLLRPEPASWLRPDLSIPGAGQPGERYYEGSPLLAIEIVSPRQTAAKLEEKVETYLAHGAAEVWVVYPEGRHARLHRADGTSVRETKWLHSALLPGIQIPLDEIF